MKNLLLALILCLSSGLLLAQEDEATTLKFVNINEFAILPAVGENHSGVSPQISTVFGVQIDDVFSVGLATGVKFVTIGFQEKYVYPHIPIALDLRILMSKGKYIPFAQLQAGYAFTTYTGAPSDFFYENVWGGLVFGGSLGYRYQINKKWGVNLSLGYQAQQNNFSPPETIGYTHQLVLGFGVNILGGDRLE